MQLDLQYGSSLVSAFPKALEKKIEGTVRKWSLKWKCISGITSNGSGKGKGCHIWGDLKDYVC